MTGSVRQERYAHAAALLIAATFTAVTIRYGFFVGAITDGSGYVSEAKRWLERDLFGAFAFVFCPTLPDPSWFVPLGYRLGATTGTEVFIYPPGLPLAMAAAMAIGGELCAYLVPPLLGGLLVWATSDLAGRIGGPYARILAAALMATSAIALLMALQPFSDVPAAAWWATGLALALRPRRFASLAAGLAVSMAILTRPNLAPLVLIPLAISVGSRPSDRIERTLYFAVGAAVGPAILLWTQQVAYGAALETGHPGIAQLFAISHIKENLLRYPRWYWEAHTPAIALAALAPVVIRRQVRGPIAVTIERPRAIVVALLVFALGVYAAYLPYFPYTDWYFLRFMLPALPVLYALAAIVLARGLRALTRFRPLALGVVLTVTAGVQSVQAYQHEITEHWKWTRRVLLAGRYLDSVLPPNAVVITFFNSGSVYHYTGRPILRPDLVPPAQIDSLLNTLENRGYRPYLLVDHDLELQGLLARFPNTRVAPLNWKARAEIGEYGRIVLYDLADRARQARGETWSVDIVR